MTDKEIIKQLYSPQIGERLLIVPIHEVSLGLVKNSNEYGGECYTYKERNGQSYCLPVKHMKDSNIEIVDPFDASVFKEPDPETIRRIKQWARDAQKHDKNFLKDVENDVHSYNVGNSDYSKHKIQPWDIWKEYHLNPWDSDVVKRILRTKKEPDKTEDESRIMDYEKIIHICKERIAQLKQGYHF